MLTASLARHARVLTENRYHNGHPDLLVQGVYADNAVRSGTEGVEIKTTRNAGGAVDTHGARDQWLCVFVYRVDNHSEPVRARDPMTFTGVYLGNVTVDDFRRNPRGELGTRTATLHQEGIRKLRSSWGLLPGLTVRRESRQLWDGLSSHVEIEDVLLNAYALVAHRLRGGQGRACACEWIEYRSLAGRQDGAHQVSQEGLRFEAGMRRKVALGLPRWRGGNHVAKRLVRVRAAKPARLPTPEVILHSPFHRLAVHKPGLPHGARHDADIAELLVSGLGAVSASERHGQSDYLPAALQSSV